MIRLAWALLCIVLLGANSFAEGQVVTISDDAVGALVNRLRQSKDPEATVINRSISDHEPRFIFVPGVFGSKIWTVDDKNVKTDIWNGDLFSPQSLQVKSGTVMTAPLDKVNALFFDVDVYGSSLFTFLVSRLTRN